MDRAHSNCRSRRPCMACYRSRKRRGKFCHLMGGRISWVSLSGNGWAEGVRVCTSITGAERRKNDERSSIHRSIAASNLPLNNCTPRAYCATSRIRALDGSRTQKRERLPRHQRSWHRLRGRQVPIHCPILLVHRLPIVKRNCLLHPRAEIHRTRGEVIVVGRIEVVLIGPRRRLLCCRSFGGRCVDWEEESKKGRCHTYRDGGVHHSRTMTSHPRIIT